MKTSYLVIFVVVLLVLSVIGYYVNRYLNYTLGYKTMVVQTICDTVKPDALKDKSMCE